jgi:hypothetical protein
MSFNLQDELQALQELEGYHISEYHEIESMNDGEIEALLEGSTFSFLSFLSLTRGNRGHRGCR